MAPGNQTRNVGATLAVALQAAPCGRRLGDCVALQVPRHTLCIPNLDARATDGAWGQVMPSPCWLQARLLKVSLIKMMPGADSCGMMVWITQQTGQPRSRQSPTASATSACSRGGIHGTFSAVGYIGHSGGALPGRAWGTLSRLAAVFAACCVAAGADSCIYDSRGGRAIAPAGTDGGRGGGVGRR